MKLYSFDFKWTHRRDGIRHNVIRQPGASLKIAAARAIRTFMSDRTTKEKFDVDRGGVLISVVFVGKVEQEQKAETA
jgi:hypothetical protein